MSSLGELHHAEDGPSRAAKITAGLVIILIVLGLGFYVVESGVLDSSPAQTAQAYPRGL